MKIEKIEPYVIKVPEDDVGGRYYFLIRMTTDEGVYGWGETAVLCCLYDIKRLFPVFIGEIFEKFVKGKSPFDRELIYKTLLQELSQRHPDLIMSGFISAVDIAAWDICGKILRQPVYNLLGGKYRERLRTYSYIYPEHGSAEPEAVAAEAVKMKERGFTAVKYDPVPMENDIDGNHPIRPFQLSPAVLRKVDRVMDAIRGAVGDCVDIMVGTHGQMTTSSSIRLAKLLEPYNPLWYEEPVSPENTKEMAKVRRATSIPIATGERLTGLFDFHRALEDDAVSILQPDIGGCGGISEARKIASIAEAYYAEMAYHVWGGPVITAAAVQLDTSIPNFLIQESIGDSSSGLFGEMQTEKLRWKDGYLYPSDKPGLGMDFDMKVLDKYKIRF
jgi:galactonate dehydratase